MNEPFAINNLIDGRYKIISLYGYDGLAFHYVVTDVYAATTARYHLLWYVLDEGLIGQFEIYRRCVRQLERDGWAAMERIVARPASYYAVWQLPQQTSNQPAQQRPLPPALLEALESYGYQHQAHWYALDARYKRKLFGLAFADSSATFPAPSKAATKRYYRWLQRWLPALVLTTIASYLLVLSLAAYTERPLRTVPDIQGLTIEEALESIHHAGFNAIDNPIAALNAPVGTAQSSTPIASSILRYGATINVNYALPAQVSRQQIVPNLVDKAGNIPSNTIQTTLEKRLQQRLMQANLRLGTIITVPSPRAAHTVLAQSPAAGSSVVEGSKVDIIVSKGSQPRQSLMPNLQGLSLEDASAWARLAGIRTDIVTETRVDTTVPPNTVLQQNILAERLFHPEEVVLRLVLSEGGQERRLQGVPDFTGMSLEQTRVLAEQKSIALTIIPVSYDDAPAGVILQTPPPQAAIHTLLAGINVWVNTPPAPLPAPIVTPINPVISATPPLATTTTTTTPAAALVNPNAEFYFYNWVIQGISGSDVLADVTVTIPDGQRYVIDRQRVNNGDVLSGSWRAPYGVPLQFELSIAGVAYGQVLTLYPR